MNQTDLLNSTIPFWLKNSLYDDIFICQLMDNISNKKDNKNNDYYSLIIPEIENILKITFINNLEITKERSEASLQKEFFDKLIYILGWQSEVEILASIQGNNKKCDYGLFTNQDNKYLYNSLNKNKEFNEKINKISVLFEVKKYTENLDKDKTISRTPHEQLMDYLSSIRKDHGFLSNGRYWRYYNNKNLSIKKSFLEFDLETIINLSNKEEQNLALNLFCHFFAVNQYKAPSENIIENKKQEEERNNLPINIINNQAHNFSIEVEQNLKNIIYKNLDNCLFELIGKSIYNYKKENKFNEEDKEINLNEIYQNSLIFLFRLLFIIYFEDKNLELLDKHKNYNRYGLFKNIYKNIKKNERNGKNKTYIFYNKLNELFDILNKGKDDIPIFNGGLFSIEKTKILNNNYIIDDQALEFILDNLYFMECEVNNSIIKTRRDYKNMSVAQLGSIYEGLLEHNFYVFDSDKILIIYESGTGDKKKQFEEYFDIEDFNNLNNKKENKNIRIIKHKKYLANSLILTGNKRLRKTSASYYTPTELSKFLVKEAIDNSINQAIKDNKPIHEIKIIDNACGSGHFLVESLNYLTQIIYDKINNKEDEEANKFKYLEDLINKEKTQIQAELNKLKIDYYEVEEIQVLKRFLLKNCIYGLDLNPFAIELTKLSLWLDSFIFGTPLSFIEHRIKCGNALIGSNYHDLEDCFNELKNKITDHQGYFQANLIGNNLETSLLELQGKIKKAGLKISKMQDNSKEDIKKSKQFYIDEIKPFKQEINQSLNYLNVIKIHRTLDEYFASFDKNGKHKEISKIKQKQILDKYNQDLINLFNQLKNPNKEIQIKINESVEKYDKEFRFFNYSAEFPEIDNGFDIIVGNPPWEKIEFNKEEFFASYISGYRKKPDSDKEQSIKNLFTNPNIEKEFNKQQENYGVHANYYKNHYPLNEGTANLFRLFVERNLKLITKNGNLNYVLPSVLMSESSSKTLRKTILNNYQLNFFYDFENGIGKSDERKRGLFPDVHKSYKFALIQIINKKVKETKDIKTAFYLGSTNQINQENIINYSLETIKKTSPNDLTLLSLRSSKDLELINQVYKQFKTLDKKYLEFTSGNNKKKFQNIKSKNSNVLVYSGENIHQFNSKFSEIKLWLNLDKNKQNNFYKLAFRDIARDTDKRSLIASLIPKNGEIKNTLRRTKNKANNLNLLLSLAWFNSIPCDWIIRRLMAQIHTSNFINRIPFLQPTEEEILNSSDYLILIKNSLILTLANDFDNFKDLLEELKNSKKINLFNDLNYEKIKPLIFTNEEILIINKEERKSRPNRNNFELSLIKKLEKRELIQSENDKIVAKLYGLKNEDLIYMLKSDFKVLNNKNPEYIKLFE